MRLSLSAAYSVPFEMIFPVGRICSPPELAGCQPETDCRLITLPTTCLQAESEQRCSRKIPAACLPSPAGASPSPISSQRTCLPLPPPPQFPPVPRPPALGGLVCVACMSLGTKLGALRAQGSLLLAQGTKWSVRELNPGPHKQGRRPTLSPIPPAQVHMCLPGANNRPGFEAHRHRLHVPFRPLPHGPEAAPS